MLERMTHIIERIDKLLWNQDASRLELDTYWHNSDYPNHITFFDLEDYLKNIGCVKAYTSSSLISEQYESIDVEQKGALIAAILSIIKRSSYQDIENKKFIDLIFDEIIELGLPFENGNPVTFCYDSCIASGSYSDIYNACDNRLMKKLKENYSDNEEWVKRFRQEYKNMKSLADSQYILNVYDYDESKNAYIMERYDYDLYEYIGATSVERRMYFSLIKDVINGIKDAHLNGIIHRDLHLGNILVKNGKCVISDFGLSKNTMEIMSLKTSASPKNNHYFVDPDGLTDFTKLDMKSDIYSIGKIIEVTCMDAGLKKQFAYIIEKSTNIDRSKRYGSANCMLGDVDKLENMIEKQIVIGEVIADIMQNRYCMSTHHLILSRVSDSSLCHFLIEGRFDKFGILINEFNECDQEIILSHILNNFAESTRNNTWTDYDMFGKIAYDYIIESKTQSNQKIAYNILKYCAEVAGRYKMRELLGRIKVSYSHLSDD